MNNQGGMWDWQCVDYGLEDNPSLDISKCLLSQVMRNEHHVSYTFDDDDGTTPLKACGDLAHHRVTTHVKRTAEVMEKESEDYTEPSSQSKRRRMLQFESEALDASLYSDEAFLRSKETEDSLEEWAAGLIEDRSGTGNECLDPASEGWIDNCFNDEMHLCNEDFSSVSGASDLIDITDLCNTPRENNANAIKKRPVHTHRNVVFKGRKSYMRTPPKVSSSVVYPFAFIKPCGAEGDTTLKDINQRIHNPPKSRQQEEEPVVLSAFSGKPVIGKTKIRTEGGKGSITIMRTKG